MNIRQRIKKLEAQMLEPMPLKIARFIVDPGNLEPSGYRCGDVTFIRRPGEPQEEFESRCIDSVSWPEFTKVHIFEPLENSACH